MPKESGPPETPSKILSPRETKRYFLIVPSNFSKIIVLILAERRKNSSMQVKAEYKNGERYRSDYYFGSSMLKALPLPSSDSTQILPPCISTICLAIESHKPVPSFSAFLALEAL